LANPLTDVYKISFAAKYATKVVFIRRLTKQKNDYSYTKSFKSNVKPFLQLTFRKQKMFGTFYQNVPLKNHFQTH
jgi:hypothetical protein